MSISFERSFASHPKSEYWNDEKNGDIKPRDVFKCSNKKFWFDCDKCPHYFDCSLNKLNIGRWCSYCCNPPKKLCNDENCQDCFNKSFASHPKSNCWNFEKNGDLNPRDVFKSSGKIFWFDCDKCPHYFDTSLDNLNKGNWCPYCANKKLCNDENCQECFNKSFASQPRSKYWNNERNWDIKPIDLFKSSGKIFWFDCDNCPHTFDIQLNNLNNGKWCSYCCNPPKKLCNDENCQECFNKSFASHPKNKYWNVEKNGDLNPRDVFKSSNNNYWFNCDVCPHYFDTSLNNLNSGKWCPYCVNQKLCNNEKCHECFNKSFASHPKNKYWNNEKNGDIKPRDVFKSSSCKKYSFNCDKNHSFKAILSSISNSNSWCPICVNKTEQKLFEKIQPIYPQIITQFKQDWCKNINHLPFDFCIPEHNIIIELDGIQHFKQIMNWKTPEEQLETDLYKQKQAQENGYSIIRLLQEEVFDDTYDWFNELLHNIKKIINEKPKIQNIYMCKNN